MNFYLLLPLISLVIIYIWDFSGFIETIKGYIGKYLTGHFNSNWEFKPFTCSTCMSFWIELILVLIFNTTNIWLYFYVFLLAFLQPRLKDILTIVDSLGCKLMILIDKLINR